MTRSLTSAVKTELATNDIRPIHLITIGFGTPINITDNSFSLTSSVSGSSVTYNASDFIMGISDFTEETDLTKVIMQQQVANIAFQMTLNVRNKVLSSYKDIMNMPV